MYAEIPKEHVETKRPLLQEEHIYTFSRFLVSSNKSKYRAVDGNYMIEIGYYTEIEEQFDTTPTFPMYAYSLTPLDKLANYIGETKNFIGMCFFSYFGFFTDRSVSASLVTSVFFTDRSYTYCMLSHSLQFFLKTEDANTIWYLPSRFDHLTKIHLFFLADVIGIVVSVSNAASTQGQNQSAATTKRLIVIKDTTYGSNMFLCSLSILLPATFYMLDAMHNILFYLLFIEALKLPLLFGGNVRKILMLNTSTKKAKKIPYRSSF